MHMKMASKESMSSLSNIKPSLEGLLCYRQSGKSVVEVQHSRLDETAESGCPEKNNCPEKSATERPHEL